MAHDFFNRSSKQAVFEGPLHRRGVDRARQQHLLGVTPFARRTEREDVAAHLDVDRLLPHARKFGGDDDLVLFVEDVDQRLAHVDHFRPLARRADIAEPLDMGLAAETDPHADAVDAVGLVAEPLDLELAGALDLTFAGLDQLAEHADEIA